MSKPYAGIAILVILVSTAGCGPDPDAAAQDYANLWFALAVQGDRDENLCHGLGIMMHPQFTCAELLDHAARVEPTARNLVAVHHPDCFGDVCGAFFELRFETADGFEETLLLKQDNNQFRTYWYRSDSLLTLLRPADAEDEEQDPLQAAYDELTGLYPALYQYPPCLDIRPSSSNLSGALMPMAEIDVAAVEQRAAECGPSFCFALVGNKIATLCP